MQSTLKFKMGILLTLLIMLCACNSQWQRYNNQEFGFSILIPGSWEIQEDLMNTVVMAMAPVQNKSAAKARTNMNVVVTELPEEVALEVIFELNKEELRKPGVAMDNFAEGEIYAGSLAGKWLSFEGRLQNSRLKIISAIWIKDRRIYTVTCTNLLDESAQYTPVFNKVLRSLRVK